jgi:hypothetical protein
MDAIADAVVYATNFIGIRIGECHPEDADLYDDCVNYIGYILSRATEAEKDALASAAKRALAAEIASGAPADSKWVRDLRTWMHDMFGDEWSGNDRV